jgi:hypothetical protein
LEREISGLLGIAKIYFKSGTSTREESPAFTPRVSLTSGRIEKFAYVYTSDFSRPKRSGDPGENALMYTSGFPEQGKG